MIVWLCIGAMVLIAYGIQSLENKTTQRQTEEFEELHRDMYEWIDENIKNVTIARERKAEVDMVLHNRAESVGREYAPQTLKEVTTKKERRERNECALEGKRYINEDLLCGALSFREPNEEEVWYYNGINKSNAEKREHCINYIMESTGCSRADAEKRADKNLEHIRRQKARSVK